MPGGATARTLAPSKEAFDAPLSPRPLDHEPGPATGCSGIYPGGTRTRWSGPVSRTQHTTNRTRFKYSCTDQLIAGRLIRGQNRCRRGDSVQNSTPRRLDRHLAMHTVTWTCARRFPRESSERVPKSKFCTFGVCSRCATIGAWLKLPPVNYATTPGGCCAVLRPEKTS